MANIAIIEAKPSRNDYFKLFEGAFDFDLYQLCSDPSIKRVLKKNVDININTEEYDWIILVGSDPVKNYTSIRSVQDYSGKRVDEKYLPVINPAMLHFKPEITRLWEESKQSIIDWIEGEQSESLITEEMARGITDTEEAIQFIQEAIDYPDDYIALDSETDGLYPRNGHMLGLSLSYEDGKGAYISTDCLDRECELLLQELFNKKIVIFHNAKFDIAWFRYHFSFVFPRFEDTMLMHYTVDETPGTHGLKQLAMRFTEYGDYEKPMYDWIEQYKKEHGLTKAQFMWSYIPFEVMKTYAAMDAVCTKLLFNKFKKLFSNPKLTSVYRDILIEGTKFIIDMQENGVPFSRERLLLSNQIMQDIIDADIEKLYKHEEISRFENLQGKPFNPNSVVQLRSLLFDFLGLNPTGIKTGTGADSTNAEVLQALSKEHEVPGLILQIRKKSKIKNTYLDKIIPQLDADSRLRTNFNLHVTTSGRLSSSGKLNMQQLPRDDAAVKGCIVARRGYKIVAMDLTTAEVYVAAVLSKDVKLQNVFKGGGDFHSSIAKLVFKLDCAVEKVKKLYPLERQAAKAVTFGIMYGAGAHKISEQVTKDSGSHFSVTEAQQVIDDYFKEFSLLKKWIDDNNKFIRANGFVYSIFGRKRRLPNVRSEDKGVQGHAIRSGLNFLVQSIASDINLLAAIDMNNWLKTTDVDARIFALVHDSILAEVRDEDVETYCGVLKEFVQMDRGVSIPGCPIGCDFEVIHQDYSNGKYEEQYGSYLQAAA